MRVLHVTHALAPDSIGGVELHLRDLLAHQARRHELLVLARTGEPSSPDYSVRDETRDGLPTRLVVNTYAAVWQAGFERTYRDPAIEAVLARTLEEFRPDVVHLHHLITLSCDLPAVVRRAGVPCVLTLYDYWPLCHRGNLVDWRGQQCSGPEDARCATCVAEQLVCAGAAPLGGRLLARARTQPWFGRVRALAAPLARVALGHVAQRGPAEIARRQAALRQGVLAADLVLAPTRALRAWYLAHGYPAERITHSPLGLPPLAACPRRVRGPGEGPRLGYVGRLTPIKGLHVLLAALRQLPPRGYTLRVFGRWHDDPTWPSYRHDLERLAAGLPVRFEGPFPAGGIADVFAELDLLVLPSVCQENAPLVIQEAKLAGLPVLGSDVSGLAEIVTPGRDGWLFPLGDSVALAERLREVIEQPARLDALSPDAASVRSLDDQARELDAHYARLAGRWVAPAPVEGC